jgi:hypothetical protein
MRNAIVTEIEIMSSTFSLYQQIIKKKKLLNRDLEQGKLEGASDK